MRLLQTVTLISFLILVSGCFNLRTDATNNDDLWNPIQKDTKYSLSTDVFLINVDSSIKVKRLALVPPSSKDRGSGYYSSPESIELYVEKPESASSEINVVGIVLKGTLIQPHSLEKNIGWDLWFGNHTHSTRYVKILSGPYTNRIVDAEDLLWKPDKYLNKEGSVEPGI